MGNPPVVYAYRAAATIARVAPDWITQSFDHVVGSMLAELPGPRRRLVQRNLRRVLGPGLSGRELDRLVRRTFISYARYYSDSFRLPALSKDEVAAGFTVEGYQPIRDAVDRGIGPVLALPHLGGWEWAAFWLTQIEHHQVTAVAEALDPPELFEWFTDLRSQLGMHIVPLGPTAASEVLAAIKACHVVCLLCDRNIGDGGVDVEFFGEKTRLPAGPATLALRTGAPLIPVAVYFRGKGVHAVCRPPMKLERRDTLREDVARITQDLAHELEELIAAAPEQWHLLQPNWPSDADLVRD